MCYFPITPTFSLSDNQHVRETFMSGPHSIAWRPWMQLCLMDHHKIPLPCRLCPSSKSHISILKVSKWLDILFSVMGCLWSLQHDNFSWQFTSCYNFPHLWNVFHQRISRSLTRAGLFFIVSLYKTRFRVLTPLLYSLVKDIFLEYLTDSHNQGCLNFHPLFLCSLKEVVRSTEYSEWSSYLLNKSTGLFTT